jgi:hypothetical protein
MECCRDSNGNRFTPTVSSRARRQEFRRAFEINARILSDPSTIRGPFANKFRSYKIARGVYHRRAKTQVSKISFPKFFSVPSVSPW